MTTRALLVLAALLLAVPAAADERVCAPAADELEPLRYLRALSLDLRGRLPDEDEVARVAAAGEVPDALVDEWLATEAFAWQVVRRHHALLWNNVTNLPLLAVNARLQRTGQVHWRRNLARQYRGGFVPCLDEPARFGADGRILTRNVDGNRVEGWVEVRPYWDPSLSLKVCAFDAQAEPFSVDGTDCGTLAAYTDAGCGCGPDLRWCTLGGAEQAVTRAMGEAVDRLVFDVVARDAPYTELFESRRAWINGPLAWFWRHQTGVPRGLALEPAPLDASRLPALDFTDEESWHEIELGPEHAGLLTQAAFLLRFQTNRARANRFFDAFLCQPFQPPAEGLPAADEVSARDPDLQRRDGCRYCHALLEPAAAHWGRWTEQGAGWLAPDDFPPQRDDCEACARRGQACSDACRRFYLTRALSAPEEPYLGMLNAYTFRREDHVRNIEHGPRLLALSGVADNRLPRCVARRAGEWLLGEELTAPDDARWIEALARDFVADGYRYRSLVRAIVTSPRYRRVR